MRAPRSAPAWDEDFESSALHHKPDGFDRFAAADINLVVQIYSGVAVRRDEFDPVAEHDLGVEESEFVAAPAVFRVEMRGLRPIAAVGGEGFEAGVDRDEGVVIGADHGRENRHSRLEIDANAAVSQVHHDVGSGLNFGHVRQAEIDVPGSRAASGEDFGGKSVSGQPITNLRRCLKRALRDMFSLRRVRAMRPADRVRLQSAQTKVGTLLDRKRDFEDLGG